MTNSGCTIRETTIEELSRIIELYNSLDTKEEQKSETFDPVSRFEIMKKYPYHKMFTVIKDNIIVGSFTLTIIEYLCHQDKNAGIMEAVVVDEDYRSQGIGREMVAFALSECKKHNCYKMALSSNIIREKAHAFYEREGFKLHGYSFYTDVYPNFFEDNKK